MKNSKIPKVEEEMVTLPLKNYRKALEDKIRLEQTLNSIYEEAGKNVAVPSSIIKKCVMAVLEKIYANEKTTV